MLKGPWNWGGAHGAPPGLPTGYCAGSVIISEVGGHPVVSRSVADEALTMLNVDPLGLDEMDRRIL